MSAARQELSGGRWHFQHGPIDLVIGADGDAGAVQAAHEAAWQRFQPLLDDKLQPQPAAMPAAVSEVVARIGENCEPALTTVLFVGGAGGSLRAGVTDNPVRLTQARCTPGWL